MGVYIDMEMPQCCDDCRLNNGISCYAVPEYTEDDVVGRTEDRPGWCPLVPVPPHGRLIDADALVDKHFGKEYLSKVMTADEDDLETALVNIPLVINNAPTVIEAEEVLGGLK